MAVPKGTRVGGRQKGTLNKATADVKLLAQKYGPDAVKKLAEMGGLIKGKSPAVSEQARVTAIKEIMDRAYGKAAQPLTGDPDNPLEHVHKVIEFRVIDPAK